MEAGLGDVTGLLRRWRDGDGAALQQLVPLVYDELKVLANHYLRRERSCQSLPSTALVNEAYLRLVGQTERQWQDRSHFYAVAAQTMRRILVDHARRQRADKRDARLRVCLDEALTVPVRPDMDLVALDEALQALAAVDAQKARVVEVRYFGGLSIEETAAALGISMSTVKRDWTIARLWLYRHLTGAAE